MNTTIQTFHADHYGTTINKLAFHITHVTIIGKGCYVKTRCEAIPRSSIIMMSVFILNFAIKSNMNNMATKAPFPKRVFL